VQAKDYTDPIHGAARFLAMITVGLFEAKAQLGQLAQAAADGEVVVLTRRGRPLAEIRPLASGAEGPEAGPAQPAIDELRRWRARLRPGPFDIAALVNEGRPS
jgi:prevent-host-death family protein